MFEPYGFIASVATAVLVLQVSPTSAQDLPCGDADRNGAVTVTDGVHVLNAAAELEGVCTLVCDVDRSGHVSVTDGVKVLRHAAGTNETLSCRDALFDSISAEGVGDGRYIFGPVVKAPGDARVTIAAVDVDAQLTAGEEIRMNVVYDVDAVSPAGSEDVKLLVASAGTGRIPASGFFVLPLEPGKHETVLRAQVRPDAKVDTKLTIDFATGSEAGVESQLYRYTVFVIGDAGRSCGNGTLDPGEQCDLGNPCQSGTCNIECACIDPEPAPSPSPGCGNGRREFPEQCDAADAEQCFGEPCLFNCRCRPALCPESDRCETKAPVIACLLAGDDHQGNVTPGQIVMRRPSFGQWSNFACGTNGSGWHIDFGNCGHGDGSRDRRCSWVLASSNSVRVCDEIEPCLGGAVFACILAGDDPDTEELTGLPVTDVPMSFGAWGNDGCGVGGTGWHVRGLGNCGGTGDGSKRCRFVLQAPTPSLFDTR